MLPDIGHVVEILIDSRLTQGVPEQRLQGPGAAGRHNHPIKPFFRNRIGNLFDGIGRTRKQLFLGKDHVGQGQRIFNRRGNIHHPADIRAPQ
jgi:ribosomal protein L21E